jgi:hypothetical protein
VVDTETDDEARKVASLHAAANIGEGLELRLTIMNPYLKWASV